MIMKQNPENQIFSILQDNSALQSELESLFEIGERIWQRGWAEANAGNVSLRINHFLSEEEKSALCKQTNPEADSVFAECGFYLVSASGSRFRQFKATRLANFVLLCCPEQDGAASQASGAQYPQQRIPTSEWITHRAVQHWLLANRPQEKVVLHSHLTSWLVISRITEYDTDREKLSGEIANALQELKLFFPSGIRLCGYAQPGSAALAELTLKALPATSAVIWQSHGTLVTAGNCDEAFDRLEVLEKAADLFLKTISSGIK